MLNFARAPLTSRRLAPRQFSASARCSAQNHYEVLGVKVNATPQEIKRQFFELSRKYHPDRNSDADPERYQQITAAYTVLSNETERRKFDQSMGQAVRQPQGYHSGRTWEGERRRPGASGYQYNPNLRWQAANAHKARASSRLDPLRARHTNYSRSDDVPHFNFDRHTEGHRRWENYRQSQAARASSMPGRPMTAASASVGKQGPSDPAKSGTSFMAKAASAAAAGVGLIYLMFR